MAFNTNSDFVVAVLGRSKPGRTYTIAPSTFLPGTTDILLNGVRIYSFLWAAIGVPGAPSPAGISGAGTDANPTGHLVQLWDVTGMVPMMPDANQFILSLN